MKSEDLPIRLMVWPQDSAALASSLMYVSGYKLKGVASVWFLDAPAHGAGDFCQRLSVLLVDESSTSWAGRSCSTSVLPIGLWRSSCEYGAPFLPGVVSAPREASRSEVAA